MSNKEGKPFMDSIFGKILIGIVVAVMAFVTYVGWVNSGAHDGNFFGLALRLPLETKDHYCWRKNQIILVENIAGYEQCLKEQ